MELAVGFAQVLDGVCPPAPALLPFSSDFHVFNPYITPLKIQTSPYLNCVPILIYSCFHFSESLTHSCNMHVTLCCRGGGSLCTALQPFPSAHTPRDDCFYHHTVLCPMVCPGLHFLSQDALLQFLLLPPTGLWGPGAPIRMLPCRYRRS